MIFFELGNPEYYRNRKEFSSTFTSWDRYSMFNDVMMSIRDVIPSCKYDDNNQVEFSHQKNHRNKTYISSRTHLQAEMKAVRFLTSYSNFSDVMTSRYDMKSSCKNIHDSSLEPINRNIHRNTCVSSF